jgi:hypothetical protein
VSPNISSVSETPIKWWGCAVLGFCDRHAAAALVHPSGVCGREMRGTCLSSSHPIPIVLFSRLLLYHCFQYCHRFAIGGPNLWKSKDHFSLKMCISNLCLFMFLLYHSGNLQKMFSTKWQSLSVKDDKVSVGARVRSQIWHLRFIAAELKEY